MAYQIRQVCPAWPQSLTRRLEVKFPVSNDSGRVAETSGRTLMGRYPQDFPPEHVIRKLKVWRVLKETYRHRSRRFGLRLNLIAALYNYDLQP